MLKYYLVAALLIGALPVAASAACTAEDAMTKTSDVSEVLSNKLSSNADAASKMMSEMGEITGTGTVTDQTCVKLDALMVRAKKL